MRNADDGGRGGAAMGDSGAVRPWAVIRQDDNGNRYRVGRYATRAEAEQVAARFEGTFEGKSPEQLYLVERMGNSGSENEG